ncbi:MAG TPA: lignostilbene-alpha,beta-dioxygenase [Cyanobacteria bacterium UBA11369]|nr:lignostilbene-alpha,beta-dioxygenase [Cyanobacteria bacterium UBA11371]HBE34890.1 lignostilbene-alpha,beta-dioxygenase [Cyanobacteria bacterium UBA11368]HBE53587.1 lignostilbene-alpha,beta-dioxygenase [Cyanobacteria bacterium UBA11369]
MSEITQHLTEAVAQSYCKVPESIMKASQDELDNVKLEIVKGNLPEDIQGHVFIVAPVGSVNSGGLPYPDGDSLLNGDGMIYRFDFDRPGEVTVKTRIVKPPDYYADKATQPGSKYEKYKFLNRGIARLSMSLGLRNQLNTAFLPMKFAADSCDRLLVTYDAGRPYEIDTDSLEVVTPVGSNKEWRGELDRLKIPIIINAKKFPCKSILSTAHPAFDYAGEGKMFTVNYGRAAASFIEGIQWVYEIEEIPELIEEILVALTGFGELDFFKYISRALWDLSGDIWQNLMNCIGSIFGKELEDFTYLVCWDGVGELERWKLVLPDGTPVKIEQTIHQLGVTKDYVVLMDTAFIMGLEQVINNPFPKNKKLERRLRNLLERPPLPDSNIYIVPRAALKAGQRPAISDKEVEVVAQKVVIPLEAAHFLVDYDNPQGNITLHVAHLCGMQVAEWLRKYDVSASKPHKPVPNYLHGMEHDETDIGRMGRYVINGDTGQLIESQVISDVNATWAVDLYAYLDRLPTGLTPGQLENVYWSSFGLWRDLMTNYIVDLYEDYKYRLMPLSEVLRLAQKGKPACLFRLHPKSMVIADRYEFPCGYMTLSPQFIPRGDGESSTNGYIVCAVCFEDEKLGPTNQIWIFDGNNLAKGPLCQLYDSKLKFGFTLHTAWLRQIGKRQASYKIPVQQDYQELVDQNNPEIRKLFKDEVYPYFD